MRDAHAETTFRANYDSRDKSTVGFLLTLPCRVFEKEMAKVEEDKLACVFRAEVANLLQDTNDPLAEKSMATPQGLRQRF